MSCDYADGLSPYENKGVLGLAEKFDDDDKVREKCILLTQLIKNAKHIVVHTGAGISTSAGIPDFRGPNGVWTLEEKGLKPNIGVSFKDAKPTKTHMAIKKLLDENIIHYVVSQNIDGLHLKSGVKRSHLAELHGNMFIEQCNVCRKQFVRSSPATTVGQKYLGFQCHSERCTGRRCRGKLHDVILDWEHSLPDDDLDMADMHSSIADLSICLGTTLQIVPSGNLPLNTLKYNGKLVICNLQPTKHDNKADLIINTYVDKIFERIMENLNMTIPEYDEANDPARSEEHSDWTICKQELSKIRTIFKKQCDGVAKKRILVKNKILPKKAKGDNIEKLKKAQNLTELKSISEDNFKTDDILEETKIKEEADTISNNILKEESNINTSDKVDNN